MSTTLSTIRKLAYDLLREEEDSSAYPYTLMNQVINSAELAICTWQVINPINNQTYKKGRLPFLDTNKFYTNVQSTTLASSATIWDTTLTVSDTSNFPSTGTLFINWEVLTYTGTTSTTFTLSSWVTFAHQSWVNVAYLYTLPTDFATPIQTVYNYSFKLLPKQYDDIFEDLNNYKDNTYIQDQRTYPNLQNTNPFYTIIDGTYLAPYNLNNNGDMIHLRYEKLPTEMSSASDTCTIDNDVYAKATLPYLAAWEILFNRWEEQRAAEVLNFWLWKLKSMYAFYNNKWYEKISWVQYGIWWANNYNF